MRPRQPCRIGKVRPTLTRFGDIGCCRGHGSLVGRRLPLGEGRPHWIWRGSASPCRGSPSLDPVRLGIAKGRRRPVRLSWPRRWPTSPDVARVGLVLLGRGRAPVRSAIAVATAASQSVAFSRRRPASPNLVSKADHRRGHGGLTGRCLLPATAGLAESGERRGRPHLTGARPRQGEILVDNRCLVVDDYIVESWIPIEL